MPCKSSPAMRVGGHKKVQKVLSFVLRHGFQLRHDAFHKAAVQKNTVIALLAFLDGQLAVEHLISVFVLL